MKIYLARLLNHVPQLIEVDVIRETPKYYLTDYSHSKSLLGAIYYYCPRRVHKDTLGLFFELSEALDWLYSELGIEGGRLQKKLNTIDEYREEILAAIMKLEDEK